MEIKRTSLEQSRAHVDALLQDANIKEVLWDSGATHALLPGAQLRMIPEKDRYKGQLAYIALAAGRKHLGLHP